MTDGPIITGPLPGPPPIISGPLPLPAPIITGPLPRAATRATISVPDNQVSPPVIVRVRPGFDGDDKLDFNPKRKPFEEHFLVPKPGDSPPVDSKATIDALFQWLSETHRVKRVYWRVQSSMSRLYFKSRPESVIGRAILDWNNTVETFDQFDKDLYGYAVRSAHAGGVGAVAGGTTPTVKDPKIELIALDALFDWGGYGDVGDSHMIPYPVEDCLRLKYPKCVPVDRWATGDDPLQRQRVHPSMIEFAYDDVNKELVERYAKYLNARGYDGLVFYTYSENAGARYQEEFGFNQPIVEKFNRDHPEAGGLRELARESPPGWRPGTKAEMGKPATPGDKENWANVRGSFLTGFLTDLSKRLHDSTNPDGSMKRRTLGVMLRRDHMTWPMPIGISTASEAHNHAGLITLDWRTWVGDKGPAAILDEVILRQFDDTGNGLGELALIYDSVLKGHVEVSVESGAPNCAQRVEGTLPYFEFHGLQNQYNISHFVSLAQTSLDDLFDSSWRASADWKAIVQTLSDVANVQAPYDVVTQKGTVLGVEVEFVVRTRSTWEVYGRVFDSASMRCDRGKMTPERELSLYAAAKARLPETINAAIMLSRHRHVLVRRQALLTLLALSAPQRAVGGATSFLYGQIISTLEFRLSATTEPELCVALAAAACLRHVHGFGTPDAILDAVLTCDPVNNPFKVECAHVLAAMTRGRTEILGTLATTPPAIATRFVPSPFTDLALAKVLRALTSDMVTVLPSPVDDRVREVCLRALLEMVSASELTGIGAGGDGEPDLTRAASPTGSGLIEVIVKTLGLPPRLGTIQRVLAEIVVDTSANDLIRVLAIQVLGLTPWNDGVIAMLSALLLLDGVPVAVKLAAAKAFGHRGPNTLRNRTNETAILLGVSALKEAFRRYGKFYSPPVPDSEYGWREIGNALLAFTPRIESKPDGTKGPEAWFGWPNGTTWLDEQITDSDDPWVKWAAYQVVYVPQLADIEVPAHEDRRRFVGDTWDPKTDSGRDGATLAEIAAVEAHDEHWPEGMPAVEPRHAPACSVVPMKRVLTAVGNRAEIVPSGNADAAAQ